MNLYTINAALEAALNVAISSVDHETGEVPDDALEYLERVQMERNAAALDVARYIKSLEAEAEAVRAEAASLHERAEKTKARAQTARRLLEKFVKPGEKLSDATAKIGWRKSYSVVVVDRCSVPKKYVATKLVETIDKLAIKAAIASGESVPGAYVEENNNIQIK